MTETLNAHHNERRAELELARTYWHSMLLKINATASVETRAMMRIYRRHSRLMKKKGQILADKYTLGPVKTVRLILISQEIEKVTVDLNRHREVLSMLRKQMIIASEQRDEIIEKMENMLFW